MKTPSILLALMITALILGAVLILSPRLQGELEWRFDRAKGQLRGLLYPGDTLPVPEGAQEQATVAMSTPSPRPSPTEPLAQTPTAAPTPTALPAQVSLVSPAWEKQTWNNCGPATLALALKIFGWDGDQGDISQVLKPIPGDKNVNVEELVYYVRTRAGWLQADFRVGGNLEGVKRFLAEGYPVIVEKGTIIEAGGGGWAGHYLLLTGYDDSSREFIAQDSYAGPDQHVPYHTLDEDWKAFNRVLLYLFPPGDQDEIDEILGVDSDPTANRQRALERAQAEVDADAQDPYAWFNVGTNLSYFERYAEAAQAFDQAFQLGLPWRFMRYQFGPYISYYNVGRYEDVIALADSTLRRTPECEESFLWRGWAKLALGDGQGARDDFLRSLKVNPNYLDGQYALDFIGQSP